ncbi:hypothetical protein TRVA0_046S00782 [Trichomonascus vanleenenianus]|uniref:uncharacterized protein n=1 Tax=Trichomonascus vanleenenianus TaxID=2268995 RepID=UPI003EC9D0DA
MSFKFSDSEWKTAAALFDGVIPPLESAESLKPFVCDKLGPTEDDLEQFAKTCPSKTPGFREAVEFAIGQVSIQKAKDLKFAMRMLGIRSVALALTGSRKLITEMSQQERERVLMSWQSSSIARLRTLARTFVDTGTNYFTRLNPLGYKLIGHPERNPKAEGLDFSKFYEFKMLNLGEHTTRAEIEVDVVIVGSGSGAGVAASKLARRGYNVLVLEKGKYYHQSELKFNEDGAYRLLYENQGALLTSDGSMTVLAGATLGGGTTVNWSASLRTPNDVREQWAEHAPWYKDSVYDDAMDYVMQQMGCSTEHINHSECNKIILDGCKKLGYAVKDVPQNVGNQPHDCGLCFMGCTHGIKQGGVVNWLRDACENGARVLDETKVFRVVHSNGRATGVEAIVKDKIELIVRAKKVIVACGSLQTPCLLKRSKFKHQKIGKGLKLHPSTCVLGDFDYEMDPSEKAILTTVCTQFADLDGRGHGPRLEAILNAPVIENHYKQWKGGPRYREDLMRYNKTAAILVITRDRTDGEVAMGLDRPYFPKMRYSMNKFDGEALLRGCIGAADVLYIEGARRISMPIPMVSTFECEIPKEKRRITDRKYQKWRKNVESAAIRPLSASLGSAHQMASCRMGRTPKVAPLNERGQLWECDNVYVVDTSVFPSASGVNPMISCMASSAVITDFVIQDLAKKNAHKL